MPGARVEGGWLALLKSGVDLMEKSLSDAPPQRAKLEEWVANAKVRRLGGATRLTRAVAHRCATPVYGA